MFEQAGITASAVYDISDIVEDAHINERGILVNLPDSDVGMAPHHNVSPRLSGTPGGFRLPAPALGEHTDHFLRDAGFSDEQIGEMRQQLIIGG